VLGAIALAGIVTVTLPSTLFPLIYASRWFRGPGALIFNVIGAGACVYRAWREGSEGRPERTLLFAAALLAIGALSPFTVHDPYADANEYIGRWALLVAAWAVLASLLASDREKAPN
jgi:hypothetical protein